MPVRITLEAINIVVCFIRTNLWQKTGNTKEGSITVPLTSCWTGLYKSVLQIKTKNVICHTADSKPVKQEVSGTVILHPVVFPGECIEKNEKVGH